MQWLIRVKHSLLGSTYQDSNREPLSQQAAPLHFTTRLSGTWVKGKGWTPILSPGDFISSQLVVSIHLFFVTAEECSNLIYSLCHHTFNISFGRILDPLGLIKSSIGFHFWLQLCNNRVGGISPPEQMFRFILLNGSKNQFKEHFVFFTIVFFFTPACLFSLLCFQRNFRKIQRKK